MTEQPSTAERARLHESPDSDSPWRLWGPYLAGRQWGTVREDMVAIETLAFLFTDLLASVDTALTKPGYGTFSEAACNGTPVLYVRRENWPEQDCLLDWLQLNARAEEISEAKLKNGDLQTALTALWQQPAPPMPRPDGAAEAATIIAGRLNAARDR